MFAPITINEFMHLRFTFVLMLFTGTQCTGFGEKA